MPFLALDLSLDLIRGLRPTIDLLRRKSPRLRRQLEDSLAGIVQNICEGSGRAGGDRPSSTAMRSARSAKSTASCSPPSHSAGSPRHRWPPSATGSAVSCSASSAAERSPASSRCFDANHWLMQGLDATDGSDHPTCHFSFNCAVTGTGSIRSTITATVLAITATYPLTNLRSLEGRMLRHIKDEDEETR